MCISCHVFNALFDLLFEYGKQLKNVEAEMSQLDRLKITNKKIKFVHQWKLESDRAPV